MYLYKNHDKEALQWEERKKLLLLEILESRAHVICLQEVQKDHLRELLVLFERIGYSHVYKKRIHEKVDGLLILYKKDLFNLVDYSKVKFYQSGIGLLNRDNVALIAKFSLKQNPKTQFVVATTHLLYNPIQLLLAEIERLAFIKYSYTGPQYLPIVLSGDLNLQPYSPVYNFIIRALIEFAGTNKNLEHCDYNCLSNCLIPPRSHVTDNCQHFNILIQRLHGKGNGIIMLEHTEYQYSAPGENDSSPNSKEKSLINIKTSILNQ